MSPQDQIQTVQNPLRLAYRGVIRAIVHEVVTSPEEDPLTTIQRLVIALVTETDRERVQALIVDELRRLHEGALSRYGLQLSEYAVWRRSFGATSLSMYGV